ncbi:MAG TPA: hypothetical protein IAC59_00835 [Candidatus Fimadaptatus faecigallinarum]|uniref:Uncharacterized protein n=1 Tax=Candidatus Fimadaptatus faecigallinarum TaxID=2840814 RepID=A0A9D1S423_9FIRM|nr:hypothetical protein [Candidatus Fimadaptatus faecigallinarum]
MERNEAQRRAHIASIVVLVTLLCILCALLMVLTPEQDEIAFNTAQLVSALVEESALT